VTSPEREELTKLRRENHRLRRERNISAKAAAWFARGRGPEAIDAPRRVFEFMSAHQAEFPIATLARVLGVSPSGF
jgi:hypothetical protein